MSAIGHIVAANRSYAASFREGDRPLAPARKLVVVTCMDARIDTNRAFGLDLGDAHVIRNAGGLVVEALRSIAISQQFSGTDSVAIVHHTGCSLLAFSDAEMRARLKEQLGADASNISFLPFSGLEESVRADLRLYRQSPIVRQDVELRGFVFDVTAGLLREVE